MSNVEPLQTTRADAVNAQAAAWLEKADFGEFTELDEVALQDWLAQSHTHRAAYWRLKAVWQESYRLSILKNPAANNAASQPVWKMPAMLLRLAAVFVVVAVLGAGVLFTFGTPQSRMYTTSVGGHEIVRFADGTQVELNTDTVVRAKMTSRERIVWLDKGEAYFQVHHDAARPLAVIADKRRITDLGTQFLVRREPGELKVALFEGSVRLGVTKLVPGEEATATATSISIAHKSVEELTNEVAWRDGVLVFKHATLADAAKAFNRYNTQKLVLADQTVAQETVGGTFRTNDARAFAAVIKALLNLHVTNKGNEIVISR